VKDGSFKTLQTLQLSDHQRFGYKSLQIERGDIISTLAAEAFKRGVPIHYSHKLTAVNEDISGVNFSFENGVSTSANILVGADGIWSKVRKLSFPNTPGPSYIGHTAFTWIIPRSSLCFPAGESVPADGFYSLITPQGIVTFISNSSDGQTIRMAMQRPIVELDSEALLVFRADKVAVLDALYGKDDNLPDSVKSAIRLSTGETSDLFLWPFYVLSIPTGWISKGGKGRVVILGDAAHAFPPTGGQGGGMAIEDAAGLGLILGQLSKFENIEGGLSVWQKIRKDRVDQVSIHVADAGNIKRARSDPSSDGKEVKAVGPIRGISELSWLYNWSFQEQLDFWMESRERSL
jgi:2-polyprenyl-6-methoxyphenol hydroxylase-like FAD-dependent oxidoreductase